MIHDNVPYANSEYIRQLRIRQDHHADFSEKAERVYQQPYWHRTHQWVHDNEAAYPDQQQQQRPPPPSEAQYDSAATPPSIYLHPSSVPPSGYASSNPAPFQARPDPYQIHDYLDQLPAPDAGGWEADPNGSRGSGPSRHGGSSHSGYSGSAERSSAAGAASSSSGVRRDSREARPRYRRRRHRDQGSGSSAR